MKTTVGLNYYSPVTYKCTNLYCECVPVHLCVKEINKYHICNSTHSPCFHNYHLCPSVTNNNVLISKKNSPLPSDFKHIYYLYISYIDVTFCSAQFLITSEEYLVSHAINMDESISMTNICLDSIPQLTFCLSMSFSINTVQ